MTLTISRHSAKKTLKVYKPVSSLGLSTTVAFKLAIQLFSIYAGSLVGEDVTIGFLT